MMKRIWMGAILICGFVAVSSASTLVFDNLGPGYVIPPFFYGGSDFEALPFTAASGGNLSAILLPIANGLNQASFVGMGLYADNAGQPGAALETWSAALTGVPTLVTLSSVLHPELSAGSTYWFVILPTPDSIVWYHNGVGDVGGLWVGAAFNPLFQAFDTFPTPGLQVISSAPEPGTWTLMMAGLSLAIFRRRRLAVTR